MINRVDILSGVSGSGKSTYAEKLLNESQGVKVSADHYFMNDGVYDFNPLLLTQAHGDCFRRFIDFCQKGVNHIVVDNTNTQTFEIAPYVLAAEAFGYLSFVVTLEVAWHDLYVLANRNVHKVPLRSIETQYRNLKNRVLPLWWKYSNIPASI